MTIKLRAFDDTDDIDPEDIRTSYPELTRCDHCGRLDPQTRRMSFLEDRPTADSPENYLPPAYWLHAACAEWFAPPRAELIAIEGRVLGAIASYDGGDTWNYSRFIPGKPPVTGTAESQTAAAIAVASREALPAPPRGWIRQRLRTIGATARPAGDLMVSRAHWADFNARQKHWQALGYARNGEYIYIEHAMPVLLYLLTPI